MNGEESTPSLAVQDLVVAGVENFTSQYGYMPIDLPVAYSQTELPFGVAETPSPDKLEGWSYLNQILPYIPEIDDSIPVGLLIGSNCVKALEPCEAVPSQNDGPCAVRTRLGWCVIGPMNVNVPTFNVILLEVLNIIELITELLFHMCIIVSQMILCTNF